MCTLQSDKMVQRKFDRLVRNIGNLEKICKFKTTKGRSNYLQNADHDLIACLVECSSNLLKGSVPLTIKQKSNLKTHLHFLRNIGKERKVSSAKRKLVQSGGFLPMVIAPILAAIATTAVSELISKLVQK